MTDLLQVYSRQMPKLLSEDRIEFFADRTEILSTERFGNLMAGASKWSLSVEPIRRSRSLLPWLSPMKGLFKQSDMPDESLSTFPRYRSKRSLKITSTSRHLLLHRHENHFE